jgi:uncharacterized paraquat-inducible protein A
MTPLHQAVCHHHAGREAVARCPECGHFYCRECIAEHDDRVICAACLRKLLRATDRPRHSAWSWLARGTAFGFSFMLGWLAFFLVGKILSNIPASFHNGTLWQTGFLQR